MVYNENNVVETGNMLDMRVHVPVQQREVLLNTLFDFNL